MMETERRKPQPFTVRLEENNNGHYPFLHIDSLEGARSIPVFSVRNPDHHKLIAEWASSGAVVAFEVGVMGVMIAVNKDPKIKDGSWGRFWEVKRGRDATDKVPIMMLPKDMDEIVDFNRLHEDFDYLKDPKKRQVFFGTLPFHTILPLREDANINHAVFVTTSEDTRKKPADQFVPVSTVCLYVQGGDKTWEKVAQLINIFNPNVHLGISSLNDHGEHSPYDLYELIKYIQEKQRVDFDFVITDEIVRKYKIRSSMTQIRLPLKGEAPEILVVRNGPIGSDTLSKHTGHKVRVLPTAKLASHGHSSDVRSKGLDDRILGYLRDVKSR